VYQHMFYTVAQISELTNLS